MAGSDPRRIAFEILRRVDQEGAYSSVLLQQIDAGLSSRDVGLITELVYGVLRRLLYLDHVIALNERQLKRVIARYLDYYHDWRTHLSLSMDAPNRRTVHPPDWGRVVEVAELGGLHHHYERLAA